MRLILAETAETRIAHHLLEASKALAELHPGVGFPPRLPAPRCLGYALARYAIARCPTSLRLAGQRVSGGGSTPRRLDGIGGLHSPCFAHLARGESTDAEDCAGAQMVVGEGDEQGKHSLGS